MRKDSTGCTYSIIEWTFVFQINVHQIDDGIRCHGFRFRFRKCHSFRLLFTNRKSSPDTRDQILSMFQQEIPQRDMRHRISLFLFSCFQLFHQNILQNIL